MAFAKVDKYRVKTFRPGFKVLDITKDEEYAKLVKLQKEGKLRDRYPDQSRGDVNSHARNFHRDAHLLDEEGNIKKSLISLEVDRLLPNGRPNLEGIIDVDTEAEAIYIINSLRPFGDKRVCLDTAFGLDIENKSAVLPMPAQKESDDFSKRPNIKK